MTTHEEISKRAREIWEREGRPEGRDKEHWLQAEAELRQEEGKDQNGPALGVHAAGMANAPAGGNTKNEAARKRSIRRGK